MTDTRPADPLLPSDGLLVADPGDLGYLTLTPLVSFGSGVAIPAAVVAGHYHDTLRRSDVRSKLTQPRMQTS